MGSRFTGLYKGIPPACILHGLEKPPGGISRGGIWGLQKSTPVPSFPPS